MKFISSKSGAWFTSVLLCLVFLALPAFAQEWSEAVDKQAYDVSIKCTAERHKKERFLDGLTRFIKHLGGKGKEDKVSARKLTLFNEIKVLTQDQIDLITKVCTLVEKAIEYQSKPLLDESMKKEVSNKNRLMEKEKLVRSKRMEIERLYSARE